MPLTVRVFSRAEIETGAACGTDALISIRSTSSRAPSRELDAAVAQAVLGDVEAILVLRFDDIGVPELGRQTGPPDEQAAQALDFVRRLRADQPDACLAIHCEKGRSRSAAIALGVLADELGPAEEAEAVSRLLRTDLDSRMAPNPSLVSLLDGRLWRYGALEAALAAASPSYVAAREHWQRIAADPEGTKAWTAQRQQRRRNEYNQDGPGDW
ncbi:hypothetical protein [Arenibaculum pallidiluteum]|uniref:hypothetical protein n=1 Tax=Arenibaculum pallidiluteum TaxID=2812559 RepID=UPI001A97137C|nr:hypothetical protein [Arenibaculum pallidiluteum]